MKQKIEPGEWERDEHGRRFRRVGASIEYAPTITTSYGEFEMGNVPPPPKIVEAERPKTWGVSFPFQVCPTMRSIWRAWMRACDRRGPDHRETLSVCGQAPYIFMYREMRFMEIL